jgi:RNA polymerase sigma-70 factor (ECF subfamily)
MQMNPTHDRLELFTTWLQEHAGLLHKVTYAFASTEADREDLTQEVLLQLWISMPRFEGKAKSSTWVYRLALNTALAKVDAALVMMYLDELSYREIAEILGISENNVGVKLNRAKKALTELVKEVPRGSR